MLAVMNLASEMMAATSSRPSFLIFQFLSPILDTRSDVILSLTHDTKKRDKFHKKQTEQKCETVHLLNGIFQWPMVGKQHSASNTSFAGFDSMLKLIS